MKKEIVSKEKQNQNNQISTIKSRESIANKIHLSGCAACASDHPEEESSKVKNSSKEKIYTVNDIPFVCLCDEIKGI